MLIALDCTAWDVAQHVMVMLKIYNVAAIITS